MTTIAENDAMTDQLAEIVESECRAYAVCSRRRFHVTWAESGMLINAWTSQQDAECATAPWRESEDECRLIHTTMEQLIRRACQASLMSGAKKLAGDRLFPTSSPDRYEDYYLTVE